MTQNRVRQNRPAPLARPYSTPGPDDITRLQLPNGIVVLSRPNFNSPSVVLSGFLQAGGISDPDEKLGLADFCAAALMRGSARHSFQEIYDLLESAGASLGISGGVHTTSFHGKALAEDLGLLLSLLSETLRQPSFPGDEVERLRAQLLTSLAIRSQDTGDMASLTLDQILYPEHPYSRPNEGYPETVQAIQRDDLAAFHSRHYGPHGLTIAVTGAVEPAQAVEMVSQALGDWQNSSQPEVASLPDLQPLQQTVRRKATIPGKYQSDILLGAPGPARRAPDFLAAALGNSVLGQFGMMGRIGEAVREQAGLAYYAHSDLTGGFGPGPWLVSAGVAPENVERAIDLILEEITRFVGEPVSAEELSDSQDQFVGRLPLSLESNAGVAAALVQIERYGLGLDYYRRYPERIRAITQDEVLEAARRYLDPKRLGIAVAGP